MSDSTTSVRAEGRGPNNFNLESPMGAPKKGSPFQDLGELLGGFGQVLGSLVLRPLLGAGWSQVRTPV